VFPASPETFRRQPRERKLLGNEGLLNTSSGLKQSALYYPYVHFRSRRWLRASMLYYDSLSRIIPPGVADDPYYYDEFADDTSALLADVSALKDCGFLIEESPENYLPSVASALFDFAFDNSPTQPGDRDWCEGL